MHWNFEWKYQYHHVSCGASIGESMEKLADHPLERKPTVDTRLRTRVVPAFRSFYMLFTTLLAQKSLNRPKNGDLTDNDIEYSHVYIHKYI